MTYTELDSCDYLALHELSEPAGNSLRVVLNEAKASDQTEDLVLENMVISGTRAIESDEICRIFELFWPSYVAYGIRNESFTSFDETEQWEGRIFCLYTKSHFLDYVSRGTFASDDYPGPLRHWSINCLNHIVDIVATDEPKVRRLTLA
jgi:hypothetical protein